MTTSNLPPQKGPTTEPAGQLRALGRLFAGVPARAYRSVIRTDYPANLRQRLAITVNTWVLHVHSTRVSRHSLRPQFSLGLGLINLFLFVILGVTGFYLMFYYQPTPQDAYGRMQDISFVVTFGRVMRNLHRWAAHAMVVFVILHTFRVFYTAAYKPPREFNWVVGVGLLLLTLALSFTGYLLPWDQLSFWAITVGTNIVAYAPRIGEPIRFFLLGGTTVGGEALLRFYVLHVAVLPTVATALIGYHLWRIRKDGGLARPPAAGQAEGETVPTFPRLVYIELGLLLLTTVVLTIISLYWNAPLESLADPAHPPNPSKAPWYFLGLQELVSYSAFWGGVMVPTLFVLGLIVLPYLDRKPQGVGLWFARQRLTLILVWSLIWVAAIAVSIIGVYMRGPNWNFYWPWQNWPGP